MGSEEMNLVSSQRMDTALNSQRVYQAEHLQYRCPPSAVNQRRGGSDSSRKTSRPMGVGGFVEAGGRFLPQQRDFRGTIYNPDDLDSDSRRGGPVNMNMNTNMSSGGLQMRGMVGRNSRTPNQQDWNERVAVMGGEGSAGTPSEEEDDDDEDDEDAEAEMDGEVDGMVSSENANANTNSNSNNANGSNTQGPLEGGFQKGEGSIQKSGMPNQQHTSLGMFLSPSPFHNSFQASAPAILDGSSAAQNGGTFYRDGLVKESRDSNNSTASNTASSLHEHHQPRVPSMHHSEGALPVGSVQGTDNYYTQLLQSPVPLAQKDAGVDEGGAFAEKKGTVPSTESPETSLRTILSDPLTGTLMDDATILSCGHSFGSGGLQHVLERVCCSCGQQVTSDSMAPNHALRAAVQAYRREEEFQSMSSKSAKRRRDKFEQDKIAFSDTVSIDCSRGKGVQFPFVVNDRVIIKGNKRTPERFVGREAVITTQCLNGWYVVKTLDNAESVKLQYRSLLKVGEHQSSNEISHKALGPTWL
ncbi:U-box domain-containing protein 62 isoform X2 [Cryptomeria japonica]|uniref:U-box domain-containing protein 62 isoform X2 n=1 Tax=Cryptomeria japonica TaxID=3369 RepID=UPI0025AC7838|nr:U-box domain-containing protein 62 isoform X2 [Cryptomeria japonica]